MGAVAPVQFQRQLGLLDAAAREPAPDEHVARPTPAEKRAQRARQDNHCARCGGTSKGGIALDVVRARDGALVAFCRSDRLRFDARDRARKAALRRTRRPKAPRGKTTGQRKLRGATLLDSTALARALTRAINSPSLSLSLPSWRGDAAPLLVVSLLVAFALACAAGAWS